MRQLWEMRLEASQILHLQQPTTKRQRVTVQRQNKLVYVREVSLSSFRARAVICQGDV